MNAAIPMEFFTARDSSTEQSHLLKWKLSFARGYLELGMVSEAQKELRGLPVEQRCDADVLELRVRVLIAAGSFDRAAMLARSAAKIYPGVVEFYELSARAFEAKWFPDVSGALN